MTKLIRSKATTKELIKLYITSSTSSSIKAESKIK